MNTTLDLAISSIIGGVLLLLLLNLNGRISQSTQDVFTTIQPQAMSFTLKEILDFDLPKIGYGLSQPFRSILAADSTRLRFAIDSSRVGAFDSVVVDYSIGQTKSVDTTTNPNQIELYRSLRKGTSYVNEKISQGLVNFIFRYYNQSGNQIPVPVSASNLATIQTIQVVYRTESLWKIEGVNRNQVYPAIEVSKTYRPRNLK